MADQRDPGKAPGEEEIEEEPTVKVTDRRLLSEEERTGEGGATAARGEEGEGEAGGEERPEGPREEGPTEPPKDERGEGREEEAQLPDPTVNDLLAMSLSMLVPHAWQKMGLQVNPATGRIVKDLEEARVAIDSAAGLIEQLCKRVPPKDADELRGMLSNLRVNFVQRNSAA